MRQIELSIRGTLWTTVFLFIKYNIYSFNSLLQTGKGESEKVEENNSSDSDSSEESLPEETVIVKSTSLPVLKRKSEESFESKNSQNKSRPPQKKYKQFDFRID